MLESPSIPYLQAKHAKYIMQYSKLLEMDLLGGTLHNYQNNYHLCDSGNQLAIGVRPVGCVKLTSNINGHILYVYMIILQKAYNHMTLQELG